MHILKKQLGMTLIELLIGISVVIVLSVASVPSVINTLNNHNLSGNADTLYADLQLARSEAVKRNATVYVSFVTGTNWCYGLNVGSSCNCASSGSCGLGTVTPTSQKTTLSATGYTNSVSFESTHGAANTSGSLTFTLNQGSTLVRLSIGKLGNVQMCSNNLSEYSPC